MVSVDRSENYLSGRIGLTNPRIFDSYYSLGGTVYANEYDWDAYENKTRGFDITIARSFWRYFSAGITYNLETNYISYLSQGLMAMGYRTGRSLKSSVTPFIGFNNTDDYYLPRSGFIIGTNLEIAGIGGDQKFIASSSNFNFYQGLKDFIGLDLIFRYKARFYKIWDTGYLPASQRIFLGGIGSLRGFANRTVSPKDDTYNYYEIGGESAFTNSVELSFPIINRVKLRGALFFDYGIIARENFGDSRGGNYAPIARYSTGLALEWITPMGPLQFVFAKPLNDKPGDDTETFEFTMGTRF